MSGLIDSLKSAYDTLQMIRKASDTMKAAELKLAIADLTMQLADVQTGANALAEENRILRLQVEELSKPPAVAFKSGAYYAGEDGPFCPTCYDKDRKQIRLNKLAPAFRDFGDYRCNVCESHITAEG